MRRKYEDHFTFSSDGSATCKICKKRYESAKSGNAALKYHLKAKHSELVKEEAKEEPEPKKSKQVQPSISNFVTKPTIEETLAKEAAVFGLSYRSLATSPTIKKGLEAWGLTPLKSVNSVSRKVRECAADKKEKFIQVLKNLVQADVRFGLVIDEWTCGPKKKRYLSVCLHRKGIDYSLGLVPISGRLCALRLQEKIRGKVADFGLDFDKHLVGLDSDGCSLMIRLGLDCGIAHQVCVVHGVHLAVTKTLYEKKSPNIQQPVDDELVDESEATSESQDESSDEETSDTANDDEDDVEVPLREWPYSYLVKKLRSAVNSVNKSPLRVEILQREVKRIQSSRGEAERELMIKCDVKTRWNTIAEMIDSVLRIEEAFLALFQTFVR